jgi:hypothetical protein
MTAWLAKRNRGIVFATSFSWWWANSPNPISNQPASAGFAATEKPAKAG